MTDKYLDETRQKVAEMRASLESAQIAIELSADKGDPALAQAKRRAINELQKTIESVELLAANLGGVPAPVRH
jgi:hypothetical protein